MASIRYEFAETINNFFSEVCKDIQKIEKISDVQEQYEEVIEIMLNSLRKWNSKILESYLQFKEKGDLGNWQEISQGFANITQKKYEGLDSPYKILLNLKQKLESELGQINQSKVSNDTKPKEEKFNIVPEQTWETDNWNCSNFCCPTFFEAKSGSYWYNCKEQNNKKFCSEQCYLAEYGEICNICKNKFLNFYRYNDLVYCSDCWKDYWKKEANRLEQELVQGRKKSEKICEKMKELNEQIKKNGKIIDLVNNNSNLYEYVETERERIKTKQQQLRISIQHLESQPTKIPEQIAEIARKKNQLKKLEEELQKLEAERKKLEREQKPKDSNLGIKIGIGVLVGAIFVSLVVLIAKARKNKSK